MKMQLALIHLEATFVHARKGILETLHFAKVRTGIMVSKDIDNRMVLEGDSRMPIKQQIKKFEIRNNLAPVFCNRLK